MSESTTRIIEHVGLRTSEITEGEFADDMASAERIGLRVHTWYGKDAQTRPLRVTWVAGRRAGMLIAWYEITSS